MLSLASRRLRPAQCKFINTAAFKASGRQSSTSLKAVPVLPDASLETFQNLAFKPATPTLLPRGSVLNLPAITKWFIYPSQNEPSGGAQPEGQHGLVDGNSGIATRLNTEYLFRFGDAVVPIELSDGEDRFERVNQPLQFFLDATESLRQNPNSANKARVYLAQAPLPDLPRQLTEVDLPTPPHVLHAGRGDIYDSSIWLGLSPTYTPLHRDPNPNFFVQLAGTKKVRLLSPKNGNAVFAEVQERIAGSGMASMRGLEMMRGDERRFLEEVVWGKDEGGQVHSTGDDGHQAQQNGNYIAASEMWEAEVGPGDALFIPLGWWHSVKGVGRGMTGSVNWWFR